MTWTSRAAGRPRLQVGRKTSAGLERESAIRLGISYTTADHRRMRVRGNVYRSSITDVKRRYTKHCNVNKMADTSGLGPSKFITLLTL